LTLIAIEEYCNSQENGDAYHEKHMDPATNKTFSLFSNFNEFNDLPLECNQTYDISDYLVMIPKRPIIIDETFQFKKIFNQSQIDSINSLYIANLKGVDLNSKSFILDSNRFKQRVNLNIFASRMDVYVNSSLIDSEICDLTTYNQIFNFFKYINYMN